MKPTVFFLINSIDLERGGLTRASLKQASFFAEMGYQTYMLTFNFNPNYPIIRRRLQTLNKIHKDVSIHNMYEELAGNKKPLFARSAIKKASIKKIAAGATIEQIPNRNAFRLYNNGLYNKYVALNKNGSLNFIDHFNENNYRIKREDFDPWGNLMKISYMDYRHNRPRQLVYYDRGGQAYLTQWNDPRTNTVERIILFNKNAVTQNYVNDNLSHRLDWLHYSLDRLGGKQSVVISDTRSTDDLLINLDHPKAAKIWRLHSSHLDKPFTANAPIAAKVEHGMQNLQEFDAAVFLTDEQKQDIINRFGNTSNLKVIPHFHETQKSFKKSLRSMKNTTDKNLCVIISRLSSLKRIDHAIRAFRRVVDTKPEARMEIWGTGTEKNKLESLIKQHHLSDHVFLKGYTQQPDAIYQRGLFSIMTSKKEGFALSVLESMYNKTPVVSYNIKYGPEDMIVDGENGYLIDTQSVDQLADYMLQLFQQPDLAIKMGKKARQYIDQHFNKAVYRQKWLETVDDALSSKFQSKTRKM